jgi:hypothetical protein
VSEYLLKLTPADLSVIDRALQEMPFRIAAPLINKINAQIAAQQQQSRSADDGTGS